LKNPSSFTSICSSFWFGLGLRPGQRRSTPCSFNFPPL
jgi:hypothetical protein